MTVGVRILLLVALSCAACGRVGFDATSADDAMSGFDATPRSCLDRPGVLFCDSFEGPNFDAWSGGAGPVMRETTIVHTGAGSLRTSSDAAHDGSGVWQSIPEVVSGSIHARAWFYLPAGVYLDKVNLMTGDNATEDGVVFLVDNDELRAYAAPPPATVVTTATTVPRARWFCIELHVDLAATSTGSVALDLDGVQVGRANAVATLPAGNITGITLGPIYVGPAQDPLTIYIDDVVIGTQPIGCS